MKIKLPEHWGKKYNYPKAKEHVFPKIIMQIFIMKANTRVLLLAINERRSIISKLQGSTARMPGETLETLSRNWVIKHSCYDNNRSTRARWHKHRARARAPGMQGDDARIYRIAPIGTL